MTRLSLRGSGERQRRECGYEISSVGEHRKVLAGNEDQTNRRITGTLWQTPI
jgi:hypothetical protein